MGKKRSRITNQEPFLPAENGDSKSTTSKKRSKAAKIHQQQQEVIPSDISKKILEEALIQQREVEEEEARELNPSLVLPQKPEIAADDNEDDDEEEEDDEDFNDSETQFGGWQEDQMDEHDMKLLETFLSTDTKPQRTLADIIIERIKEKDAQVSSEARPMPKLDNSIIDLYKGVGKLLSKYTSGKLPKAFKHIPSMQHWEEVLYLTEPEKWSPHAMLQATKILTSNLNTRKTERFYKLVLLPRVREDIRKNQKLHFCLYQSLKKSIYKPAAFNKGILLPLCQSRTCNLREAVIIGSILQKISIPHLHSSVALLKLAEMEYCGTTSYFIKILIEKKYALPYRVIDAIVVHFMTFVGDSRVMPVIWHQSLLAFVQRYKHELTKEDKDNLNALFEKQRHYLVTPEISRELSNSRNRGEKEEDPMSISTLAYVINKTIEEDRFDIPEVPMEED